MSRTLVVVTCQRDQWGFEMLCRSMEKYLKPCNVIFICNDTVEYQGIWRKLYNKHYKHHLRKFDVRILVKEDFWNESAENHLHPMEKEGWVDQQVIKLGVADYVKTKEYVILDAKNFFISDLYLEEIQQVMPEPTGWCEPILKNWIVTCAETMGLEVPASQIRLTQNITPYIFNTQLAQELLKFFGGTVFLFKWFTLESRKPKHSPAEFFLYEMFTIKNDWRNLGTTKQNCIAFWQHMHIDQKFRLKDYIKHTRETREMYDPKVASFHKGMVPYWTETDVLQITKELGCLDIMPTLHQMPFTGEKSYTNRLNTISRA